MSTVVNTCHCWRRVWKVTSWKTPALGEAPTSSKSTIFRIFRQPLCNSAVVFQESAYWKGQKYSSIIVYWFFLPPSVGAFQTQQTCLLNSLCSSLSLTHIHAGTHIHTHITLWIMSFMLKEEFCMLQCWSAQKHPAGFLPPSHPASSSKV